MNLAECFQFAWRGVTANKSRSALTMLGVLIGVASVIVLVAVGAGASAKITSTISSLGSDTLTVTSTSTSGGGRGGGGGGFGGGGGSSSGDSTSQADTGTKTRDATLTMDDAQALTDHEQLPDVAGVAPVVSPSSVTATYQGASHSVQSTVGTTPAYLSIDGDSVETGSSFSDSDYLAHSRVVLLGSTVAQDLAGGDGTAIVDHQIELNGSSFTVLGILVDKGSFGPQDNDDRVIAPATSVQDTLAGYGSLGSISVKATSAAAVSDAQTEIEQTLDTRHHTTSSTRDFSVSSSSSTVSAATTITTIFTWLLGAVAGISLLVGGIGVMNIMLVTVTERTREIGIRKAIGAPRSDIVGQFLIEAILLSAFGGLLGVIIGVSLSQITIDGFKPIVKLYAVVIAFAFACAVGLFFGIYPARRAASLRPIDALRYE